MARTMKAAVMYRVCEVRIEEVPLPEPKEGQVLVKMKSVGVCGSDVHFYEWGRLGDWTVTSPLVLGHECSGEIVEVGEGVSKDRLGQRPRSFAPA